MLNINLSESETVTYKYVNRILCLVHKERQMHVVIPGVHGKILKSYEVRLYFGSRT